MSTTGRNLAFKTGSSQPCLSGFFCRLPDLHSCVTFAGLRPLKAPPLQFSTTVEEIVEISWFSPQSVNEVLVVRLIRIRFGTKTHFLWVFSSHHQHAGLIPCVSCEAKVLRCQQLTVRVPNGLFRDWLTKHYGGVITEAVAEREGGQLAAESRPFESATRETTETGLSAARAQSTIHVLREGFARTTESLKAL